MFIEVLLGANKRFTCWLSYSEGPFITPFTHRVCGLPENISGLATVFGQ